MKIPITYSEKIIGVLILLIVSSCTLINARRISVRGVRLSVMESGEMHPTIAKGDMVISLDSPTGTQYAPGDVIVFESPYHITQTEIRRISSISQKDNISFIRTKGDASQQDDAWQVTGDQVFGRYEFAIPFLGYAINFLRTPYGFLIFLIPLIALVLTESQKIQNELPHLMIWWKERRMHRIFFRRGL